MTQCHTCGGVGIWREAPRQGETEGRPRICYDCSAFTTRTHEILAWPRILPRGTPDTVGPVGLSELSRHD